MKKLQTGQYQDGNRMEEDKFSNLEDEVAKKLDPKIVASFTSMA